MTTEMYHNFSLVVIIIVDIGQAFKGSPMMVIDIASCFIANFFIKFQSADERAAEN